MTPFIKIQPNLANTMAYRNNLLAAPLEYFKGLFGRRVRTLQEKLLAIEQCVQCMDSATRYQNDTYVVLAIGAHPFIHLIIHRHDWESSDDWREFQQIKNAIVGPEYEAMELFPAESRLVDTSNTYHLWVHCDPAYRFPVGLPHRLVSSESIGLEKQRAFA
jgi:hypothetical protein